MAMYVLDVSFTRVVARDDERHVETAPVPALKGVHLDVPRDLDEARAADWTRLPVARSLVEKSLVTYAAGPVSQMILSGEDAPEGIGEFYLHGGPRDAGIIRQYALALASWENEDDTAAYESQRELIRWAVAEAVAIVANHLDGIAALADRLELTGELSGHEARTIPDECCRDRSGELMVRIIV